MAASAASASASRWSPVGACERDGGCGPFSIFTMPIVMKRNERMSPRERKNGTEAVQCGREGREGSGEDAGERERYREAERGRGRGAREKERRRRERKGAK